MVFVSDKTIYLSMGCYPAPYGVSHLKQIAFQCMILYNSNHRLLSTLKYTYNIVLIELPCAAWLQVCNCTALEVRD